MAKIDELQRAKSCLESLKQDINKYATGLPNWQGTTKDSFVKKLNDINNSDNYYSPAKILSSINSFIFNYNKHN